MIKSWSSGNNARWGISINIGSGYLPVYQQLVEQFRFHVTSGLLQPGEKLPTVRELASALGINFNTVAKAYHELAGQGFILGRKGGGSSVVEQPQVNENEKEEQLKKFTQRLMVEAAAYGLTAEDIKRYFQKEGSV